MSRKYPNAWSFVESCIKDRGKNLPNWQNWCFCPMAAAYAVVSATPNSNPLDISVIAALAAWRVTQGIYRFDQDILDSLLDTPISKIPREVIYNLPEWCVYVEVDKETTWGHVCGFFAHLEFDSKDHRHELRFLFDTGDMLFPIALHISESQHLDEAIEAFLAEAQRNAGGELPNTPDAQELAQDVAPFVSLILYLCSEDPDIEATNRKWPPERPRMTKTKTGRRMFQAEKPTVWETTFQLGRKMREARASSGTGDSDRQVRAHIRRAHWHSFWTGVKSDPEKRRIVLKWLNPILVNFDGEEVIPTIRKVKDGIRIDKDG